VTLYLPNIASTLVGGAEILALRHRLAALHRQLDGQRVRFDPADRAWLAALLHRLPRPSLRRLRLLVRPDAILRWHRDPACSPRN
jgi:putative transposase